VSDSGGGWQTPGSGDARETPRYGQYGPPPGQPPVGGVDVPAVEGWAPPPKPGLVPLRPMGFGTLLGAPFKVLRQSRALIGLALALQVGVFVVGGGILVAAVFGGLGRVTDFEDPDQQPLIAGGIAALILSAIVLMILSVASSAVLQGFVVVGVARAVLGQRTRLGEIWRVARSRVLPLIGWTLLVFLAIALELAIVAGIMVAGAAAAPAGLAISIPLGMIVGLGFIVLTVWLSVKLSLLPSALVLEHRRLGAALRRSWSLTNGYFWRTFGVQALLTVMISVATQVITTPISLIPTLLGAVIDPNGTGPALVLSAVSSVLSIVFSLIIGAISSVVLSSATALIYLDLRMRKEGLDLVLQRHVERPDSSVDPFAPGVV